MKKEKCSVALTRRVFAATLGGAALATAQTQPRPNILWLTCEDISPNLGCYGDTYARTPNLDKLAKRGLLYRHAWSNAPVCAPARTTIISGIYPPSTGAEHMRSMTHLPATFQMFPSFLRKAGYYCTNNAKEDYNLAKPAGTWDESSKQGHWRNRKPGQPFFAVFNHEISHESQIRTRPHQLVQDPREVRVPAYHPDTPEVRHDWAQYYDNIHTMDGQIAKLLEQLDADGLSSDTVVFFYGDHGSGMPRSKRWPYNSGLQVPLLVYIPEKFRHLAPPDYRAGGSTERLVSFIDLAPTVLSLAGIEAPAYQQGHAFLGSHQAAPQPYLYGFRGRMDERYDLVRTVTDGRYVYIRNYHPHRIYGQHLDYMWETPTTRVWEQLYLQGKLKPPQTYFWEQKPPEELYDLSSDRDEVRNLAGLPQHQAKQQQLRKAQQDWAARIFDVGFLPENEIHERSTGSSPYEVGHDSRQYPFREVFAMAELAAGRGAAALPALTKGLTHAHSAVRYWGAMGFLIRSQASDAVRHALKDQAASVQIVAAETLGRFGLPEDLTGALSVLTRLADPSRNGMPTSMMALNAVEAIGIKAKPAWEVLKTMPTQDPKADPRMKEYCNRLLGDLKVTLGV